MIGQRSAVAAALEVGADREIVVAGSREVRPRIAEEAAEIDQEPRERRAHEIAALREEAAEAVPRELEVAALAAHRERHRRRTQSHAQLAHEFEEFRVVTLVANYEPRVERMAVGVYCVGVASRAPLRFVEDDVAVGVETVRGSQPGYAGTDDGNLHRRRGPARRPQLSPTV